MGGPGVGHPPHHGHRKQSVASLGGAKAHRSSSQDTKRGSSSGRQGVQHKHKAALIREMETKWYLKMFGLGKEDTVAHQTGMSYRSVKSVSAFSLVLRAELMSGSCLSGHKSCLKYQELDAALHIINTTRMLCLCGSAPAVCATMSCSSIFGQDHQGGPMASCCPISSFVISVSYRSHAAHNHPWLPVVSPDLLLMLIASICLVALGCVDMANTMVTKHDGWRDCSDGKHRCCFVSRL